MENVGNSIKIKCLIDMALKGEISWTILASFLDEVSTTLLESKQVIKILLKNLENLTENMDSTMKEIEQDVVLKDMLLKNCDSEDFRLVEQYKDQLYTFVGDSSIAKAETDNLNVLDNFPSKEKSDDSKAAKDKTKKNPYLCNTCNKTFVSMVI